MRAHVGKAADAIGRIAGQEERLLEGAGQEREWIDLSDDLHEVVVPRVMPRTGEDALALRFEDLGVRVDTCRKRPRDADVLVDVDVAHDAVVHRRRRTATTRRRKGRQLRSPLADGLSREE